MTYEKVSLNGEWQLQPGEKKPTEWQHHIPVPALVDLAQPLLEDWQKFDYFWFRKEFQISNQTFNQLYLQLQQVQFGTQVWLNDHLLGGDIPCYTSQWFDLTPYAQNGNNLLLVRVGARHTLPPHSPVGNDFEKPSWIPGIWGDIWLHKYGRGRITWTQIIPDIRDGKITVASEVEHFLDAETTFHMQLRVWDKNGTRQVAHSSRSLHLSGKRVTTVKSELPIPDPKLWSPETPFLYELESVLEDGESISHRQRLPFGMREFAIHNGHFYLNGQRRVLLGSNIAFHRLLSDSTRGLLPWQEDWIKKVLVEIPKAHNLFFFRFHLGHAYNRWYDIADEHGIMLQDEWPFWTTTGSPEQIEKEFRDWVRENGHHPSIVIWDALNEATSPVITERIIPKLKQLDPTRPWEPADFVEDHPYIYSLGPVLNAEKFGYTRPIFEFENSRFPTMVNEFEWWWLDRGGNPTPLTQIVLERWLGPNPSRELVIQHQAFLANELGELWRRLNVDAIMPFVYLSAGEGYTANWFFGPLKELRPKPVLAAYKNTLSPLGVSIELWDRHFCAGERRPVNVFVFNDTDCERSVLLCLANVGKIRNDFYEEKLRLSRGEHRVVQVDWCFPEVPGSYELFAEVLDASDKAIAWSRKPAFVFAPFSLSNYDIPHLVVQDAAGEIVNYLRQNQIPLSKQMENLAKARVVFFNHPGNRLLQKHQAMLTDFVGAGGVLILQEPEFEVARELFLPILENLEAYIQYRKDTERGGYDSYVFPEETRHPLWRGLTPEHFKMFNGALGGEVVSQHSVRTNLPFHATARCGLGLKVPAVLEIPYGSGWVVISRIQVRGRLQNHAASDHLYARRYDPVAERYFWNLLTGYVDQQIYHQGLKK